MSNQRPYIIQFMLYELVTDVELIRVAWWLQAVTGEPMPEEKELLLAKANRLGHIEEVARMLSYKPDDLVRRFQAGKYGGGL